MTYVDEIWLTIDILPYHEISSYGRIRSIDRYIERGNHKMHVQSRLIKQATSKKGYKYICTQHKHHLVHRLVGLAFIPNPMGLPQINHKDSNKINNHLDNLEWCDNSYNQKHSYGTPTRKRLIGNLHPSAKSVYMLDKISGVRIKKFSSISEAGKYLNKKPNVIVECLRKYKNRNDAHGYRWEYAQ